MKPETRFRINSVNPFLKKLKNTTNISVQQKAISGTPDNLLCAFGRFVGLELKTDIGTVSELQKVTLGRIHRTRGVAMVVCPANWEDAKKVLLKLDNGEFYDQNEIFGSDRFSFQTNSG